MGWFGVVGVAGALATPLPELRQAVDTVAARWEAERPFEPGALDDWYGDALGLADDPASTAWVRWAMAEACRTHDLPQLALAQYETGLVGLRGGAVGTERLDPEDARAVFDPGSKAFSGRAAVPIEPWFVDPSSRDDWVATDAGARALEVALLVGAGNLYLVQGQFDAARVPLDDAIAQADRTDDRVLRVGARTGLAWLALRDDRPDDAIALFDAVDTRALPRRPRIAVREAWLAAGAARLQSGKLKEARRLLGEAERLYDAVDDAAGAAMVGVMQGQVAEALGKDARAARYFDDAAGLAPESADAAWAAAAGQARLHESSGDRVAALGAWSRYLDVVDAQAKRFLTDQGQFSVLESQSANLDRMVALAIAHAEASGDAPLAHRAMARARRRSLPVLLSRRDDAAPRTAGVLPVERVPGAPLGMEVQMAEGVSLQMAAGVRLRGGDPQRDLGAVPESEAPFATVAPPSDTWSLAYYALPERLVVTLRDPDGGVQLASRPVERETLRSQVLDFRRALGAGGDEVRGLERVQPRPERRRELSDALYATLVSPIEAFLPAVDVPLLVIPDATLWSLPFAALRDDGGRWFGDRILHLGVSEGAVATSAARRRPARDKALVVGNPGEGTVFTCGQSAQLSALPGAEAEARAIADLYGEDATLLVGDQADGLRLEAWHPDFGVLHLATHGYACARDPLDSIVQLGTVGAATWRRRRGAWMRKDDPRLPVRTEPEGLDGPRPEVRGELTAREVIDRWQLDADLVALSACETGLGQSSHEGTIGLLRAFVAAGARSVLVSLWPVDDDATQTLMVAFHEGYRAHGNKARALRDAMATTRERFTDPQRWSGFVLVGPAE